MHALRLLRSLIASAVGAFLLVLLLAATAPMLAGQRSYVVRSGSMAPAVQTGDVVSIASIRPTAAKVGDIVTFTDRGRFTQHRVRSIVRRGAKLRFTTQGDANTGQEQWEVVADGTIGRVVHRVPRLGFALVRVQTLPGQVVLIVLPALLLGGLLLRRIWSAPDAEVPHVAQG